MAWLDRYFKKNSQKNDLLWVLENHCCILYRRSPGYKHLTSYKWRKTTGSERETYLQERKFTLSYGNNEDDLLKANSLCNTSSLESAVAVDSRNTSSKNSVDFPCDEKIGRASPDFRSSPRIYSDCTWRETTGSEREISL